MITDALVDMVFPDNAITLFRDDNRWCSNFYRTDVEIDDIIYPSSEHAYVAFKKTDIDWRKWCANCHLPPGKLKRIGSTIILRDDWKEVRLGVMRRIVEAKFRGNEYLKSKLIKTGDILLVEGNYHDDKFWGYCLKTNIGFNHLGKILMEVRSILQKEQNETS